MDTVRLFFRLAGVSLRSQMQHKASSIMLTLAFFLSTFVEILGIWILFDRFKLIKGWSLPEVALLYGTIHMAFSAAEALARGFDTFSIMVKQGDFDRVLLRPRGTLLQIATSALQLMRIGRFLQGLIVLIWGYTTLGLGFYSYHWLVICMAFIGTFCLFYALYIIQATLTFWMTESLELMNITTYGGVQTAQYPLDIYSEGFRFIFTYILPFGCVIYFPIASLLEHSNIPLWLGVISPLAGVAFLFAATQLWKVGVRHYTSVGS
ncbi:MAG: ABC-2 family transporter protein [Parachlamydiales bacterium]|jgi:ABC-2 type transport system permease protein